MLIVATGVKSYAAGLIHSIQLRTAASRIRNQLVCAKTRALRDSRVHCGVFFDTISEPQRVLTFFDEGALGFYTNGVDAAYMAPFNLPGTVTLSIRGNEADNAIVFRGDGSTNIHGMQISVSLKDRKKIISVLPSTGRIKIIDQ